MTPTHRTPDLRQAALDYHAHPRPGKLEIRATKPMATGRDLSLAYSPGVAEACLEISRDPAAAARYTTRGNLVAVVSNGTAVLGLGDIGPLASKPVMEGKAVLFKKFAGVDCIDIEVNERDPRRLADIVCALEPSFGAINLEDIKAPECFEVERLCRARMGIPVFHDDQHGTAIVAAAAASNALRLADKRWEDVRVVALGAGAAGVACLRMFLVMGVRRENILLLDSKGVVHTGRNDLTPEKAEFARDTALRVIDEALDGADLFLGVSGPGLLTPEMIARMAPQPIVFALANPTPEIMPDEVRAVRPDAIVATGRSDFPNQVNNVLCFPFIFRGALDVGATCINDAMKAACVEAIAALARAAAPAELGQAYQGERMVFGPDYLIPKPFDPRLLPTIALAVAEAAIASGVATRPIDPEAYRGALQAQVFRTFGIMRNVFAAARAARRRVVFAEGEDDRALRIVHSLRDEAGIAPILVGRPEVIAARAEREGLRLVPGADVEVVNPESDPRFFDYWSEYHRLARRQGVSADVARTVVRTNTTAIAALMVRRGDADSMICGLLGEYRWHLRYAEQFIGRRATGALSLLMLDREPLFLADTQVHLEPGVDQVTETVLATARHVRRFGLTPKVALCAASLFGTQDGRAARTLREVVARLHAAGTDFEIEGEMTVEAALDPDLRERLFPDGALSGRANALVFAGAEIAAACRGILRATGGAIEVGPILMGLGNRVQIVTPDITPRGLMNVAALAGTEVGEGSAPM